VQTQVYLTPNDHGRRLSREEFEHAASQEGYHYELIDGRLEVSPVPDFSHEHLRELLKVLLDGYAREHPESLQHVKAPARVFVPGRRATTAPEPDIAGYRDFPTDRHWSEIHWQDISPVLVVEILSPANADKDLHRNLRLYLAVPTIREYWIVDPREDPARPDLMVYRRRDSRWQHPLHVPAGSSYTTRLLPGFTLTLTETGPQNGS
jgi:Uma2 family endonuclease